MSDRSLVPASESSIVEVIGTGASIASNIVAYLSRYSAEMILAGITGIRIAFTRAEMTVHVEKRSSQANYAIKVRSDLALRFSRAIDSIEQHPEIRPSIKAKAMKELEGDLDEIYRQIREDLSHNPLA